MSNAQGWVKLYRQIKDWQHYQEPTVLLVFIDILTSANTKDGWYKGKTVCKGELVTSVASIMASTGIKSNNTVIDALKKLEKSGEIKRERFGNATKITITQFSKYQDCANTAQPTAQPTAHEQEINRLIIQEEKNNVVTDARAHTCEADFSEIENTETANFRLVCLERGWNEEDYFAAVEVFRLTCEADNKSHDSAADQMNHFRSWCNLHYKYGEKPLKPESDNNCAIQKNCFDEIFAEFYREKFGTDFIFRKSDQKAISSLLGKIVLKMQEHNAEINLTEKQNALRAFLRKSYDKADKWLKENFTPSILDNKFNEIYGKLKQNTTAGGNSRSFIERIASELAGIQP